MLLYSIFCFPTMFPTVPERNLIFSVTFILLSASAFNFDQSKICHLVKGYTIIFPRYKCPQENIPPKVEKEVIEKLLDALRQAAGLKVLPTPLYTRVQLWGAAVPLNIFKVSFV